MTSCTLISPTINSSKAARVIFPGGENPTVLGTGDGGGADARAPGLLFSQLSIVDRQPAILTARCGRGPGVLPPVRHVPDEASQLRRHHGRRGGDFHDGEIAREADLQCRKRASYAGVRRGFDGG
ncbi:hypothetical protein Acr_29g0006190 [Actinidia rufa]|uniref:Uncharacterized protein n=1 Tax=Actinidia rufa TaxID=165716 RepID=A0A7J0HEB3_9ERIC|nr:hypothetical protein Acr_29g0006190 [Actinidia rufa]